MTTEQAIKLLHRLQDEQFDGIHGDERREALSMAVRALEQNLGNNGSICTKTMANDEETGVNDEDRTTDDLISRKMAIDAIKSYWKNEVDRIPKKSTDFDVFTQICDSILTHNANICKVIDKLPSAQPERKSGQLLYHHTENIDEVKTADVYFCSSCKKEVLKKIRFGMFKGELNIQYGYCPHCGARMEGESDD